MNTNFAEKAKDTAKADDILEHVPHGEHVVSSRPLTDSEKHEWLKRRLTEYGTNSMMDPIVQLGKKIGGKIAPNKINDESFANFLMKYQKPLLNADRKAGEFMGKKTPLKGLFRAVDDAPGMMHTTNTGKQVVNTIQQEGYRLTAPVDKVKHVALPTLGVLGIQQASEIIHGNKPNEKTAYEEGDAFVNKLSETLNLDKELIEKISNMIDTSIVEKNEALEKASEMLKKAATEIRRLNEEINKVAEDNKKLTLQVIAKERSNRAVKLAKEMMSKGLVKKAELNNEIDRIMDMDDNAFNILKDTIGKVAKESNPIKSDKLDKISGIYEYNINNSQVTFKDEILKG